MNKSLMLILLLAGCGCAFSGNLRACQGAVHSWLGRPVSELEAAWGRPQSAAPWGAGLKVYTWAFPLDHGRKNIYKKSGPERKYETCEVAIVVDAGGRVSSFNPTPEYEEAALGCGFLKTPPPGRSEQKS